MVGLTDPIPPAGPVVGKGWEGRKEGRERERLRRGLAKVGVNV